MIKVSVVIPVYNVEDYLPACLDSVLGQSLRDLECICIDDASPDHCGEILDAYAARDRRVRVIHLPENHMQGYGRNRGLECARGEYVYFLDSDDMITPTALEELYRAAKEDDLDGIFFDSQVIIDSEDLAHYASSYLGIRKGDYPDAVISGTELLDLFVRNNEWMVYVQRQFWKRTFLIGNGIFSPEKTEHEDELFSFEAILLAERVRYLRKDYFIHRYRANSVMTRAPHPKDFHGYFRIFCRMVEFVNEHHLSGIGVEANIVHIFECAMRFMDDFEKKADPGDWFLPEEQKEYRLVRSVLYCQKRLKEKEMQFWAPLKKYDHVWIYGAGRVARSAFSRIQNCGMHVPGFLVTDPEGNPDQLFDLPVRPIGSVDILPEGSVVVVAMAATLRAVPSELLRQKGFPFYLYFNNVLTAPDGQLPGADA